LDVVVARAVSGGELAATASVVADATAVVGGMWCFAFDLHTALFASTASQYKRSSANRKHASTHLEEKQMENAEYLDVVGILGAKTRRIRYAFAFAGASAISSALRCGALVANGPIEDSFELDSACWQG
jgi:hypothetical protein